MTSRFAVVFRGGVTLAKCSARKTGKRNKVQRADFQRNGSTDRKRRLMDRYGFACLKPLFSLAVSFLKHKCYHL